MPSTPDIIVECEHCEQVADLVRYRVRGHVGRFSDDAVYRAIVAEVAEHVTRGEWSAWPEHRKETAVAVAQRMAKSLLWGAARFKGGAVTVGDRVTVRKPGSPNDGRAGTVTRDAGVAEYGPDKGRRFWWVEVPGTKYGFPFMYREDELR